jgi:signal transduction histidine kinase
MLSNQPLNHHLEASLKFGTFEFNYGTGEMLWSVGMYKIFDCDVKYYSPVIEQHSIFFRTEDIEKLATGIKNLEKFQQSFELITTIRTATHKEKHIKLFMIGEFVDGKICKRKGFTQDISFEIKEQEENAFFRERVNLALYATNTGTWDYHVFKDKLYWDDSMFVLFDIVSVTDIRGFSSWVDIIHRDDRDEFINHFNLGTKGLLENHTLNFTSRIMTSLGRIEFIKINARFYFDENNLNYRVIGTCINSTKEQMIQTEIVTQATLAQENLIKAQDANNSRALFLANMSHEIRTPLNTVMGALQIMQSYDLDMDSQSLIDMAMQSSSDLLSLIDNILELSKIDANEMRIDNIKVDIHDLGQKAIDKFKLNLVKPIKLKIEVSSDFNPYRNTDPVKINQIMNNLLGNAIKFTQSGTVLLRITGDAENVVISVKDTGIGIPQPQIEHIFEIFKQADESTSRHFGGTGLGLAICKGIAEKMNGEIIVSSLEGKGSTFTFRAPMPIVSEE